MAMLASHKLCISSISWDPRSAGIARSKVRLPIGIQTSCRRASFIVVAASAAARSFKVTLRTPEGEKAIEAAEDVYVAEAAENAGVELPISCRSGNCSSCAARLISGQVDQSDQTFLDDEQVAQGFILTCVAYPLSDIVVETHQESCLYA